MTHSHPPARVLFFAFFFFFVVDKRQVPRRQQSPLCAELLHTTGHRLSSAFVVSSCSCCCWASDNEVRSNKSCVALFGCGFERVMSFCHCSLTFGWLVAWSEPHTARVVVSTCWRCQPNALRKLRLFRSVGRVWAAAPPLPPNAQAPQHG